jgi:hypothetical protein
MFVAVGSAILVAAGIHPVSGESTDAGSLPWFAVEAAASLGALQIMARFAERKSMRDIGFAMRGIVTETTIGTMIGMAAMSCAIGILALFGIYHVVRVLPHFHPWAPLAAYLLVAVSEESVFRGYVFRVFEDRYGSAVALVVGCLLFGLVHLANPGAPIGIRLMGSLFIALEAGLLLSAAYMATRRMWLPIGIHWAWNYFEGPMYGASVSGTGSADSMVKATVAGPLLASGGVFGPEGSLACLIVCTLGGIMMLRAAIRAGQWKPAPRREACSDEGGQGQGRLE